MEEYQHVCKLCSKRFPCGRSLGGHMRSHVIMSYSNTEEAGSDEKQKKLSSLSSFDGNAPQTGYGLRENPKKTCRFENSSEEVTLANDKICKECGKGFSSWKALFGHMKCHSEKVGHHHGFQEEDNSWGSDNQKMVVDDQSDNDEDTPNRRRRRSRRMSSKFRASSANGTTASSTLSFANTTNSSSIAEIQQEQEEVALCLMMLSRDVNHNWGGFDSFAESSDIDSAFLEPLSSIWADEDKEKTAIKNCQVVKNPGKLKCDKSGYRNLDSGSMEYREKRLELQAYGISNNGLKMKRLEVASETKKLMDEGRRVEANLQSYPAQLSIDRQKRNFSASYDPQFSWDYSKKSSKRSKFECTTCNKIFHSYQALGGHRASHKKIKGCFASRTDQSSENSIETGPLMDHKFSELSNNESLIDHEETEKNYIDVEAKKLKYKSHECPICFKVFFSGQALGGHKRSHLIGGSYGRISSSHSIVIEKPISEIQDFLDLNLPAPAEEESSSHHVEYSKPWWVVESSHKHEPLMGMISN